jgi:DNA-binding XRE family transcriptional regulator
MSISPNIKVKEFRESLKFTQTEFGESIGLKGTQVRDIENSKTKVSPEIAEKIKKAHNINPSWLLFDMGEMFLSDMAEVQNVNSNSGNNSLNNYGTQDIKFKNPNADHEIDLETKNIFESAYKIATTFKKLDGLQESLKNFIANAVK